MDDHNVELGQVHDEGVIHQDHRIRLRPVIEVESQENQDPGLEVKFSQGGEEEE